MTKLATWTNLICFFSILSACSPSSPKRDVIASMNELSKISAGASSDSSLGSATNLKATYKQIGLWLETTMVQCPERIWPTYDWRKMNVLMLEKGQPSLVWRGSTGTVEDLAETDIPVGARQGIYSFFDWHGEDAVAIYSDGTSDYFFKSPIQIFELIIHEGFHRLGQKNWHVLDGQRGTVYPVDADPRLYRRMIYDRISEFYESGGTQQLSLAHAAYWFQEWRRQFPVEVLGTTDGYEGTARYVEYLGATIAESGCNASDDQLKTGLEAKIVKDRPFMSGDSFETDGEGYALGSLSAFTLRLVRNDRDWFAKMVDGETPVSVLLQNINAVAEIAPADLKQHFQNTKDQTNKSLGGWMDSEILHQRDQNFVRVAFSSSSMQGAYSPKGFYIPATLAGVTMMPLAVAYSFGNSTWAMTAEVDSTLAISKGPCGGESFSALIEAKDYRFQTRDAQLVLDTASLHGSMPGEEKRDSDGFVWFCGQ